MSTERLPRSPAVELAQALVEHLATSAGVRVLALKGPVLAHHGLRDRRASSDADVLVEPGAEEWLQAALAARGWTVRFEREMPAILERHSVTLLHPRWPVDIDLHWYFPGLHAAPAAAFEALWEHRQTIQLAHRDVTCLDLPASALIAAVHCVRYPQSGRHRRELEQIRARVGPEPEAVEAFSALARRTRSAGVLADVLADLGVAPGPTDLTRAEQQRWQHYTETHEWGSTGAWLHGLKGGSLPDRLHTVARAVWPDRAELAAMRPATDATAAPMTVRQRWSLRARRWQRALTALGPTLRALRRSR
jgi:Uncharacterised nucleotidyltransferase